MSELLSSITGGGGGGVIETFVSGRLSVAFGSSGDVIVITPPSGESIQLTSLRAQTSTEGGITVTVGARVVVNSLTLTTSSTTSNGQFSIATVATAATESDYSGCIHSIIGGADEIVKITKDSGTLGQAIHYSYKFIKEQ